MVHLIGDADDFWRLRVTRLDTTENFDFEWHDDILYRRPTPDQGNEVEVWHVEAVRTDAPDIVARLASCGSQQHALSIMQTIAEDLATMTKSEFEITYVDRAEPGNTGTE